MRAFRSLVAILRAEKPDLVHAHMPISGFLARLAARVAGVPKVAYTCHGFLFNHASSSLPRRVLSFVMEWIAARVTDVFLTVSEAEARDARRLHIAAHAEAVRNGRDPAVFRPDPAARDRIRAELGVARRPRGDHRGLPPGLAQGLSRARRRHAVGAGGRTLGGRRTAGQRPRRRHGALLRGAGLGYRLRMLGYRADIPALLAAADIFTLPSRFEGLPMSVIEAMLTGLPVVATNVRGPAEQVVDGVTGLQVPAGDAAALGAALGRLVRDPDLRAAHGAGGPAAGAGLL